MGVNKSLRTVTIFNVKFTSVELVSMIDGCICMTHDIEDPNDTINNYLLLSTEQLILNKEYHALYAFNVDLLGICF